MIKRNFNEEATSQASTTVSADPEKNVYDKVNNYSQSKDESTVPDGTKQLDAKFGSEDSTKNSPGAQHEFANSIKEFIYILDPSKKPVKESVAPEPEDDNVPTSFAEAVEDFNRTLAPEPNDGDILTEGSTMKNISKRLLMTVADFNKKHPGLLRKIGKIKDKSKMEEELGVLKARRKLTDAEYNFAKGKWKIAQENPTVWKDLCAAMSGALAGSLGGPLGTIAGAGAGYAASKVHDVTARSARQDLGIKQNESVAPEPNNDDIFNELSAPEPNDDEYVRGFFMNEISTLTENARRIEYLTVVENFKNFVNAMTRVYFESQGKEPEAGDIVSTADASNIVTDAINGVLDTGDRDKIISDRDIEPLDGDISLATTVKIA